MILIFCQLNLNNIIVVIIINKHYNFRLNVYIFYLDEISDILSMDKPNDVSVEVYKNFLTIFMGSFYGSCRDLVELKHLVIL